MKNIRFVHLTHVQFNNHHKFWGTFVAPELTRPVARDRLHTFWGFLNSSIHINLTEYTTYDANAIFQRKKSVKYLELDKQQLIEMWPEFDQKFMESWLEVVLSQ